VKLMEWLRKDGFHSSLSATYSCDLPWYERILQERFRLAGCHNNLLLVDGGTYAEALPSLRRLAPGAGRRYTVLPVQRGAGAFHPKIILQVGERQARALITSANLSTSGFGVNRELATELLCTDVPDDAQALIAAVYDYLRQFCLPSSPSVSHHLEVLERDAPWLARAPRWRGPTPGELADTALLLAPGEGSFVRQFSELVMGDPVQRLIVLAPFWDPELAALAELDAMLAPEELVLIIQPDTVQLRRDALKRFGERVRVLPWSESGSASASHRYLHAKLYLAEGTRADHLVSGSANCSVAALGLEEVEPVNAEACVYRALAPGTGAEALGLSSLLTSARRLTPNDIRDPDEPKKGAKPVDGFPGVVEISGSQVFWWPEVERRWDEAHIEFLDESLRSVLTVSSAATESGPVVFELPEVDRRRLRYARLLIPPAEPSSLVLIHFLEDLRAAAPGVSAGKLQNTIERIRQGDASLTELLEPFESLFFDKGERENQSSPRRSTGGRGGQDDEEDGPGDKLSYEEFLSGRAAGKSASGQMAGRTVSRVGLLVEVLMESLALAEEPLVEVLEPEELGEQEPDEPPPPRTHAVNEVRVLRGKLGRMAGRFVDWGDQQRKGSPTITCREMAEIWAAISLVTFLMGESGVGPDGSVQRVVPLLAGDGEVQFPTLVRDVLGAFFCVHPALVGQLHLPAEWDFLPAEVEGALIAARWAACLGRELAERSENPTLVEDFEVIGRAVFRIPTKTMDVSLHSRRGRWLSEHSRIEQEFPVESLEHWFEWFEERVRCERAPEGWKPQRVRRLEKEDLQVGESIWTKVAGLRYIRELKAGKVYVNNPGAKGEVLLNLDRGFVTRL
jgi:hypothetical protein